MGVSILITDLTDNDFAANYDRLVKLFPDRPWLRRVELLRHQVKDNPLLGSHLRRENSIAYGLAGWEEFKLALPNEEAWAETLSAIAFAAQVVELCEGAQAGGKGERNLPRRVHGALRNPSDMRALLFELHLAVALHRRGCKITWTDESRGKETFDMLVEAQGMPAFELECKSFAMDKGEAIPHGAALALLDKVLPLIHSWWPLLSQSLIAVTIDMQSEIPTDAALLKQRAQEVADVIGMGGGVVKGLCEVSVTLVDLGNPSTAAVVDKNTALAIADAHAGGGASYHVFRKLQDESWGVLRVRGPRENRLIRDVETVAKNALKKKQLTGTRPACLALQFEGVFGNDLLSLSIAQPGNTLARLATKLLSDPRFPHLACVSFMSMNELTRISDTSSTGRGTAYFFDSPMGIYPGLGIGQLFSNQPMG